MFLDEFVRQNKIILLILIIYIHQTICNKQIETINDRNNQNEWALECIECEEFNIKFGSVGELLTIQSK